MSWEQQRYAVERARDMRRKAADEINEASQMVTLQGEAQGGDAEMLDDVADFLQSLEGKKIFIVPELPSGWFIYGVGECVKPQIYAGDRHDNTGEGFWAELQRRDGGRLTKAKGSTIKAALENAVAAVLARGE